MTETDAPAAHQTVLLPARSEKVLPPPSERAFTPAAWSIDQPITAGFSAAIAEAYRNCESTVLLYPQRERHGVTRQFLSAAGVPIADASAAAVVLVHRAARQARSDIAVSVFRDKLAGNGHRRPADDAAPIGAGDD
ncbi:MAG TPA: hypothetical protein VGS58_21540 [Candidatus Sulfopaludibacter sp.]|nr:hypothetical protein [Candidatus Sulfopaludibacter sp.]